MHEPGPPADRFVDIAPGKELHLVGPPDSLRCEMPVCNPRPDTVVLRRAVIRRQFTPADAANAFPVQRYAPLTVTLRSGQARVVPLVLDLGACVAPGDYPVTIEVEGRGYPAICHVVKVVRLQVSPSEIILTSPLASYRVVLANCGNVPLTVGDLGEIALDEESLLCRVLRRTVARVGDSATNLDDLVVEMARQAREAFRRIGSLRVTSPGGPVVVQPGETTVVDWQLRVSGTETRSLRVGRVQLFNSKLTFRIGYLETQAQSPVPPEEIEPLETNGR